MDDITTIVDSLLSDVVVMVDSIIKPGKYDSWTIIDETTAIKHMDRSAFLHHVTGLPKGMCGYFDTIGLRPGDRFDIALLVYGDTYNAHIERGAKNGYCHRLFWESKLEHKIKEIFDYDFIESSGDYPYMTFNRITNTEFEVFFSDGQFLNLESDEESYAGSRIDDELFERLIRRKSDREIEVIVGEISMDEMIPVEKKVVLAKRIIRDRAISSFVKHRADYRCEICGVVGFLKEGGGRYAEAHHLLELGKMNDNIRSEHPDYMICVCPTCHRIIHYGISDELESRRAMLRNNTRSRT